MTEQPKPVKTRILRIIVQLDEVYEDGTTENLCDDAVELNSPDVLVKTVEMRAYPHAVLDQILDDQLKYVSRESDHARIIVPNNQIITARA